jgi:hypothetical protein
MLMATSGLSRPSRASKMARGALKVGAGGRQLARGHVVSRSSRAATLLYDPHEPPRAALFPLVQWPATRGFVVGVVVGIPRWHARGQGFKSPQLHHHPPGETSQPATPSARTTPAEPQLGHACPPSNPGETAYRTDHGPGRTRRGPRRRGVLVGRLGCLGRFEAQWGLEAPGAPAEPAPGVVARPGPPPSARVPPGVISSPVYGFPDSPPGGQRN